MLRKILSFGSLAILSVLIQLILIIYAVTMGGKMPVVGIFYHLLTYVCIFYIVNSTVPEAYKLSWVIPMLCFPLYGGVAFLLFNKQHSVNALHYKMKPYLDNAMHSVNGVRAESGIQQYLADYTHFPLVYSNESHYYPVGGLLFEEMLKRIAEAKEYIFLEFFIIAEGKAWDKLEELLFRKADEGLTIRIIADGAGCLFIKPPHLKKKLAAHGIEYKEFNPVGLRISGRVNYRNHRKILVCDGKYAFCCGINISDEYMNYKNRFGHWKDTGIMVSGKGAESFAAMFCGMWNFLTGTDNKTFISKVNSEQNIERGNLVQPFSESPLDNEATCLRVYLSLIAGAQKSVRLTTPYLICSEEMLNTLEFAAKKGVKVQLITPGVPDKRYVYTLTRSHYKRLIKSGVEIYEYSPGFIHSKTLVIDSETAVGGTINFDYRSMYLLFECACIFYGGNVPKEITEDFEKTLLLCHRIKYEEVVETNVIVRIVRGFLKLFAPLM